MNWLITTLLLALHLIAMNLAVAGPLVCAWLQFRSLSKDDDACNVGRQLAWYSLWALIVGMLLGGLLVVWFRVSGEGAYWDMLCRLPCSIYVNAAAELVFSFVLLLAHAWAFRAGCSRPWLFALLPMAATTNLLYHFPPLMSAMRLVAASPDMIADDILTRPLMLEVMSRGEVMALTTHFALASIAVAGVALMCLGARTGGHFARTGAVIAMVPTLIQLLVGVWALVQAPATMRDALMGSDAMATSLFAVSLVAVFALLHLLAGISFGDTGPRRTSQVVLLLLTIIVLMVGATVRARDAPPRFFAPVTERSFTIPSRATPLRPSVPTRRSWVVDETSARKRLAMDALVR